MLFRTETIEITAGPPRAAKSTVPIGTLSRNASKYPVHGGTPTTSDNILALRMLKANRWWDEYWELAPATAMAFALGSWCHSRKSTSVVRPLVLTTRFSFAGAESLTTGLPAVLPDGFAIRALRASFSGGGLNGSSSRWSGRARVDSSPGEELRAIEVEIRGLIRTRDRGGVHERSDRWWRGCQGTVASARPAGAGTAVDSATAIEECRCTSKLHRGSEEAWTRCHAGGELLDH